MTTSAPDAALPVTLRWAVRLLYVEAAAVAAMTAFLIYSDLTATAGDPRAAIGVTVFAALGAVALAAIGRSLGRRRAGTRGPAIVLQVMFLMIGFYLALGGLAWAGVPLMILALAVGGLIVSPTTTRALGLS